MRWERSVGKEGGCPEVSGTEQLGRAVPPRRALQRLSCSQGPAGGIRGLAPGARAVQAIHSTTKPRLLGRGHLLPAAGARSSLGAAGIPHPRRSPAAPSGSQQLPAVLRDPRSPPALREVWPCFTGHGFGWCSCSGGAALSSPLLAMCNLDGSGGVPETSENLLNFGDKKSLSVVLA